MSADRETEPGSAPAETRCGYVAILGAPNAGKSTLLNALVGAKVAIVTPKVQTTRSRITGIALRRLEGAAAGGGEVAAELVFIDTPGIFAPRRRLEKAMVAAAWSGAADADLLVLVVDAGRGFDKESRAILEGLKGGETKAGKRAGILVLNKVDTVPKPRLLELASALNTVFPFAATFMIQATSGEGVEDLAQDLARRLPAGPFLYPEDQLADISERLLAAEITREKLFLRLRQELPYALTVETESFEERRDGSARLSQVIYVARESQRAIILGEQGRTIKAIGAESRAELEQILARRIHLFLFVKVRKDWQEDPERYREMGLDFPR